jgi:hypothetical protein
VEQGHSRALIEICVRELEMAGRFVSVVQNHHLKFDMCDRVSMFCPLIRWRCDRSRTVTPHLSVAVENLQAESVSHLSSHPCLLFERLNILRFRAADMSFLMIPLMPDIRRKIDCSSMLKLVPLL